MNKNVIEFFNSSELVDYKKSIELMEKRVEGINEDKASELLWFLEHPSIYTAGTSSNDKDLLNENLFPVFRTNRGGQFTYHGPGQRVAYVMLNVRDRDYNVKSFIRLLEQWIMNSLMDIGIKSFLIKGKVGIWVNNEEKIASLGLRIRKGISFHGISLNINPNLEHFSGIIPCGNENSGVTSIEKIGLNIKKKEIDKILISNFKKTFEVKIIPTQTLS
ncbi:MAG: lipoate-protein ligase B [Rhodobiaceae bacterium]|nr:lipoate-protein ligase B [Rhodobiaceae bacterium]|tara:strand:+ start:1043 stop:1696 length:654 start_codon:yes stop_codon:yes gene_type:complete